MHNKNHYRFGFWHAYDGEPLSIYTNLVFIIRSNTSFCLGGVSDHHGFCVTK